jgi:hypothetical protein
MTKSRISNYSKRVEGTYEQERGLGISRIY